jgi:hypothetical protein
MLSDTHERYPVVISVRRDLAPNFVAREIQNFATRRKAWLDRKTCVVQTRGRCAPIQQQITHSHVLAIVFPATNEV